MLDSGGVAGIRAEGDMTLRNQRLPRTIASRPGTSLSGKNAAFYTQRGRVRNQGFEMRRGCALSAFSALLLTSDSCLLTQRDFELRSLVAR